MTPRSNATALEIDGATCAAPARRSTAALLGCLGASVLVYACVYRPDATLALGPLRNLAATLLASLPFAVAAFFAARAGPNTRLMLLLLFGLLALRLAIPLDLIAGSDDAYRYLWDGKVHASGINPYLHAPAARELASLRDATLYPHIYRSDMRTVYPPLAQLWFLLAYLLAGASFVGLKLIYVLNEIVALFLLTRLLAREGRPPLAALLYAWSPLAVVQLYAAAHLDVLLVPWLVLALLCAEDHPLGCGLALGASAMVRPITALCLPALALRRRPLTLVAVLGGFAISCALLIAPYLPAGTLMIESLLVYGRRWIFNPSLYLVVRLLPVSLDSLRPALYVAMGLMAVGIGLTKHRVATKVALTLAVYLAFAPTVYPWYFIALLPLAPLRGGPLWVALPALVTLTDLVFVDGAVGGRWAVPMIALWIEYGALYALAAWSSILGGRVATRLAD